MERHEWSEMGKREQLQVILRHMHTMVKSLDAHKPIPRAISSAEAMT